jgi:hypothetical protein
LACHGYPVTQGKNESAGKAAHTAGRTTGWKTLALNEQTDMDMIEQIKTVILSHHSMAVIAVVGVLALILALKIAHLILRVMFVLLSLAAIGTAVWWFFLRH